MKSYKSERNWSDLERADKVAVFVGVLMWLVISTGVYAQSQKFAQLKQNMLKTEMLKQR